MDWQKRKKSFLFLGLLSLLAGIALFLPNSPAAADNVTGSGSENATISVVGKGELVIKPDVAYIQLGVFTEGKTAKESLQKNADQSAKVMKSLEAQGIAAKDIKTVYFHTYPQYDYSGKTATVIGYQTTNMVEVTYRNMDKIGSLIDVVTDAGANRFDQIRFGTEKYEDYEVAVIEKALDNAKKKANAIAAKTGKKIKGVKQVIEEGASGPVYRQEFLGAKAAESGMAASTPVSPGELKLEKTLQVIYE